MKIIKRLFIVCLILLLWSCNNVEYDKTVIVPPDGVEFYWPYLYKINKNIDKNKKIYLLIQPNNTGFPSNEYSEIYNRTIEKFEYFPPHFQDLNVICMGTIFPRFIIGDQEYDFHSMNLNSITLSESISKRLDLQLQVMIGDLKERLEGKYDIVVEEKVLLYGFSASANFVDKFSYIHPELVEAIAMGGNSEYVLPLRTINNENLPFPIGIYNFEQLFNKEFDFEQYKNVRRYVFRGEDDLGGEWIEEIDGELVKTPIYEYHKDLYGEKFNSDKRMPVYTEDPVSEYDANLIRYRINNSTFKFTDIFLNTETIFNDQGISQSKFVLYPDIGHDLSDEIYNNVVSFFSDAMEESDQY